MTDHEFHASSVSTPTLKIFDEFDKQCLELNESVDWNKNSGIMSSSFDLGMESVPVTGRPSLLLEEGRESLGILPQYKARLGLKHDLPDLLEDSDSESFLLKCSEITCGKAAIDLLLGEEQDYKNKLDTNLLQSDPIDNESMKNESSLTDEKCSVCVEANFLAAKMADNSIFDTSQESPTILDKTPQPEFIEDSISMDEQADEKIDANTIYKQLDKMIPLSNINNVPQEPETIEAGNKENYSILSPREILNILQTLNKRHIHPQAFAVLSTAINKMSEIIEDEANTAHADDSGHSSTGNEKEALRFIDSSARASSTHNLIHTSYHTSQERRLSITFSHQNDPALPIIQPSNNLRQQTMHMKMLWGSIPTTMSSDNSSNSSKVSCSTGSLLKIKLKPRKSIEVPANNKKGPMKAVASLVSLNSSLNVDQPIVNAKKAFTPRAAPRPVAQSTPEDCKYASKKTGLLFSPLSRPKVGRVCVGNRLKQNNFANALSEDKAKKSVAIRKPTISRRRSTADLKQNAQSAIEETKKPVLRRCNSVGGKENKGLEQSNANLRPGLKVGKVEVGVQAKFAKPLNLARKMKK